MAFTIISVKESKGTYEGTAYHNFNVVAINPESDNKQLIAGGEVETYKIKADDFVAALNRNFGALGDPKYTKAADILGLYISPVYNKFGGVTDFTLAVPEKKKG